MIEQLRIYENNVLAIEVIDGYTETDEKLFKKFYQGKINKGYKIINILVKLDELKIGQSSIKAFMEESLWLFRKYKNIGHLAIVAHSGILSALVPIDNLFFKRASQGRQERYFDVSEIEEAFIFVNPALIELQ